MNKKKIRSTAILLSIIFVTNSCKKDEIELITELHTNTKQEIPFTETWQRQFEAIGNLHTSNYLIYQDSIRYTLTGAIGQANYLIQRDTFLLVNNRFIGHTDANQHYLIFVKDVTTDSIILYKQKVIDVAEGMTIIVPEHTTTANYGWNTFYH